MGNNDNENKSKIVGRIGPLSPKLVEPLTELARILGEHGEQNPEKVEPRLRPAVRRLKESPTDLDLRALQYVVGKLVDDVREEVRREKAQAAAEKKAKSAKQTRKK